MKQKFLYYFQHILSYTHIFMLRRKLIRLGVTLHSMRFYNFSI